MSFYHRKKFLDEFKMRFQNILIKDCRRFPIHVVDGKSSREKSQHDQIVALVTRMLDLHRQRAAARTPQEQISLDRQIQSTDREIDRLVYDLYGLTEEEIRIVEGTEPLAEQPAAAPAPEAKAARLPQGKSTPQSEADAAHFYSAKEDPVPYRTANSPDQKGD